MSGQGPSEREKSPNVAQPSRASPKKRRRQSDSGTNGEGGRNPCFLCMGTCFLLTAMLVVLAGVVLHFVRPSLRINGTAADAPICKGALELTSCDNETDRYFFHHDPDKHVCLVRWQLDPGCLGGKNRFTSATECRKRCVADPSGKYGVPADCVEPIKATPCTHEDITQREHNYFFENDNCTFQTGSKCLHGPNRFVSTDECHETCIDGEEPACRVPRFQAACRLREKRFTHYYDRSVSACVSWRTACLGGPNRHESLAACVQTCKRNFFDNLLLGL
ncbi:tissue factor pathway inhibitor-like isoform X2 [Dermacentor albipictus]|uniref:tissue factor pathway inhibitor-like isoform X2 n=1 Tax=Dermacentor albipictus TaxID=60249 RepID=UPI0031FBE055